jgi:predicted nucleotide-binding protein
MGSCIAAVTVGNKRFEVSGDNADEVLKVASGLGHQNAPELVRSPQLSRRVFIVHGHDEAPREGVARFLEQHGLGAVILHEQPNSGRTIITKFREEASKVGFAVVLLTPDDHGGKAGTKTKPRARQNVIFELGFFVGALGPERVVALVKGDIERPSDFDGVAYISLDRGDWKTELYKELKAAELISTEEVSVARV